MASVRTPLSGVATTAINFGVLVAFASLQFSLTRAHNRTQCDLVDRLGIGCIIFLVFDKALHAEPPWYTHALRLIPSPELGKRHVNLSEA